MAVKHIPTMCLNCSTVCGMIAKVEDGEIRKLEGNSLDPNSGGKLCAKGQAAINMVEDPDRILYPMRRSGPRGSGKWERISWDEAIKAITQQFRTLRKQKRPEEMVLLYGRDRTNGFLERFTHAFGTPNKLGHRGLCSLNKRMAIRTVIGDTDWDTPDFSNSHYILNFGSNFYEAHQGHVGMLARVSEAKRNGARLVTFDVRLSNTAAQSDEWLPIFPGTDGLVALAIGHVILRDRLQNDHFIQYWTNASLNEWKAYYQLYTPEWAEQESGIPAIKIEEIAHAFASAAPRATTITNRGTHAHKNGFYNEWAVLCLNALVGSIGEKGGWCYIPGDVNLSVPQPGPLPPKPRVQTELSHPTELPFVNQVYPRAASSTIFPYIAQKKASVDTLLSYYVNAPMSWPEGPTFVRDVLLDEDLIPFHVVIDAFHSEMVEVADYVLPDATFLEKWDLDARNSYELRPYVGLRQPVIPPPGECKDIRDILIALAKETDEEMAKYFSYDNAEHFIRVWAEAIPGGLEQLEENGIWEDKSQPKAYMPYLQKTTYSTSDSDVKTDDKGIARLIENDQVIGRQWNGEIVKGFSTPDRRFQFKLPQIGQLLKSDAPITPVYRPIKEHKHLGKNEYILTTFKWNVHTQSRTANQLWLTEIVGENPCWIHPRTAELYGIEEAQDFKILARGREGESPYMIVKPVITEAIHPRVLAISASFGHWQYGRTAKNKGYNPNPMIPNWTDDVGGGQSWNDTVVLIEQVT
ncbi:molybdopterin-containing oxidoreductase family protein [Halobacillus naozhouensis]|uniref:Molybdopterin-dependent oxidoreductase n=1 Tax=Halobacillus naozhouensis TaxID=554880 RepID=A0ABY8J0J0_9BACI|nr:molybdopterin-dependent oxidoreductase [Halobacillus naozhouensis]WFT74501.1 molybdopterin-dependent oxidoreductase [Halobacillus naozhouensis]